MSGSQKTELQRDILLAWYQNPNVTNKQIAEACDCSASYVSTVKNRFDDYNEFEAMMDRQDREMEQMFGADIFGGNHTVSGGSSGQPGLAQQWEEVPNNAPGLIIKAIVLIALLYAAFQFIMVLV
ncbi:MarR family transcriptional regulator [Halorubrum sp. 48-1-W]|uniref:MarR family transcriptional regulator n=1 Tax=Halorubrum sp. 48-1-W TaxID=2249761 RepID=UPI000DCD2F2D|nr:MarR family transcriptional regulator [Halorubrum sp. 48-1-W]RAW45246.1 MarR family transcriptional regulator [Halorubrum sp. 48-1-W]